MWGAKISRLIIWGRSQMTSSKNLHFYPPPPSEQKMTSSWPDPPPPPLELIFFRFMLFNIDINVKSGPSYDTIFQYLLKLNASQLKGFWLWLRVITDREWVKKADFLITQDMNGPLFVIRLSSLIERLWKSMIYIFLKLRLILSKFSSKTGKN